MQSYKSKLSKIIIEFDSKNQNEAFYKMQKLYEQYPDDIEINKIYGKMALKLNESQKAIKCFNYILSQISNDKEILEASYKLLINLGKFEEALIKIDKLLQIENKNFNYMKDKAFITYNLKNYELAKKYVEMALKINSMDYFLQNIYGLIYLKENKLNDAIKCFRKSIENNKSYVDSYNNLGVCFFELEDFLSAFSSFKKAYRINKNHLYTLNNLGNSLSVINQNKLALFYYKRALEIRPNYAELLTNISISYMKMNDEKNANKFYIKSININPNDHELKYAYSVFQLSLGNFNLGWKYYDSRFYKRKNYNSIKNFDFVKDFLTDTKNINFNKKTLILREQGLGDEIVFSSLYPDIIKKFSNVVIESDERLVNIFKYSFNKNLFYPAGFFSLNKDELSNFDQVFYIGSIAKFFRKNEDEIPGIPYLFEDKKKTLLMENKINTSKNNKKIGVSWKSRGDILGNFKSISVRELMPLFKQDRSIINMQYGDTEKEIKKIKFKNQNIISLEEVDVFSDLDNCLAMLKCLDYFVTIDNSTAHLAGALGIKTILIIPKKSSTYFYWKAKDGYSIWYKSVRIIKIDNSISNVINLIDKIISGAK